MCDTIWQYKGRFLKDYNILSTVGSSHKVKEVNSWLLYEMGAD